MTTFVYLHKTTPPLISTHYTSINEVVSLQYLCWQNICKSTDKTWLPNWGSTRFLSRHI